MPLFEFRCRACGHVFEALVRPADGPRTCPTCQSGDLERLLTSFAVNTPERSRAAATVKREKAASVARRDNVAREREIDEHRKEDH
jgi:putative FmdB family regulatory protein